LPQISIGSGQRRCGECGLIIPDPQKPDKLDIGRGRTSMLSAANAVRAKLGI
jgi:hypothetical protein